MEYVIAFLQEEARTNARVGKDAWDEGTLREAVEDALEAYDGGAR